MISLRPFCHSRPGFPSFSARREKPEVASPSVRTVTGGSHSIRRRIRKGRRREKMRKVTKGKKEETRAPRYKGKGVESPSKPPPPPSSLVRTAANLLLSDTKASALHRCHYLPLPLSDFRTSVASIRRVILFLSPPPPRRIKLFPPPPLPLFFHWPGCLFPPDVDERGEGN